MTELNLGSIVANEFCCPFDGKAFELLMQENEAKEIMDYFLQVFDTSGMPLGGVGNSLARKIATEMSRYYYRNEKKPPSVFFTQAANGNPDILQECEKRLLRLVELAENLKYKTINEEQLNYLKALTTVNGVVTTSRILNQRGIKTTINTISNFPEEIYQAIHFG